MNTLFYVGGWLMCFVISNIILNILENIIYMYGKKHNLITKDNINEYYSTIMSSLFATAYLLINIGVYN